MSSDFYKRTLLTFYMQHEIELDVSFNLLYSFPMITKYMRQSVITNIKNLRLRQCISIVTMAHVINNDIAM